MSGKNKAVCEGEAPLAKKRADPKRACARVGCDECFAPRHGDRPTLHKHDLPDCYSSRLKPLPAQVIRPVETMSFCSPKCAEAVRLPQASAARLTDYTNLTIARQNVTDARLGSDGSRLSREEAINRAQSKDPEPGRNRFYEILRTRAFCCVRPSDDKTSCLIVAALTAASLGGLETVLWALVVTMVLNYAPSVLLLQNRELRPGGDEDVRYFYQRMRDRVLPRGTVLRGNGQLNDTYSVGLLFCVLHALCASVRRPLPARGKWCPTPATAPLD